MTDDALLDVPSSRRMLGNVGNTLFYSLLRDQKIKAVKLGRRTFCKRSDLQAYLDSLEPYSANGGRG